MFPDFSKNIAEQVFSLVVDSHVLHWSSWVPLYALAPNCSFPSVQTTGGSRDISSNWVPTTLMGDLIVFPVPCFCFHCSPDPKPALTIADILGSESVDGSSVSLCASQMKKYLKILFFKNKYVLQETSSIIARTAFRVPFLLTNSTNSIIFFALSFSEGRHF